MDCRLPGSTVHGVSQARILVGCALSAPQTGTEWILHAYTTGVCYKHVLWASLRAWGFTYVSLELS